MSRIRINFHDRRVDLQRIFEDLLDSRNVYFQPPTGTKLQYPCIVYKLDNEYDSHADDHKYRRMYRFSVTYMTKDPEDPIKDTLDDMQYCSMNTFFASDNLNHYVYTIYH